MDINIVRVSMSGFLTMSLVFFSQFVQGCAREQDPGKGDEATAIVHTVENPKFAGDLFSLEVDLTLGIDDGEPVWQIFGRMIFFELGPEGRIYLMDMTDNIIYIVSREGDLLGQFGGQGSGPGEFIMPTNIYWIQDGSEVWINDGRLTRITRWTPDGELIDTFNYAEHRNEWDFLYYLGGRQLVGMRMDRTSMGTQNTNIYGFLNEDLSWKRDFITLPGQQNFQASERGWMPLPFTVIARAVFSPEGRIVVGRPYEGRFQLYDSEGTLQITIEHDWESIKVLAKEKQNWLERMRARSTMVLPSYLEKVELPDRRPAFFSVQIDDIGWIWIERARSWPRETSSTYDIFGQDGTWLGVQTIEFSPNRIKGGYVYRIETSEEQGPRLIRYRLQSLHSGLGRE